MWASNLRLAAPRTKSFYTQLRYGTHRFSPKNFVLPLPRVPGPNPLVNPMYKRRQKYTSIKDIKLPLSVVQPPGGHPEVWVHNSEGRKLTIMKLSPDLFNQPPRNDILCRCIKFETNRAIGMTWHIVRTRGEIAGSTRKIRQQKGTGRARHGDKKAPCFVGGGKAHGRRPKDYTSKLNKKIRWLGLKVALSTRYREGDFYLFDDFIFKDGAYESAYDFMEHFGWHNCLCVYMGDLNKRFMRSTRNYVPIQTIRANEITIHALLKFKKICFTVEALKYLTEKYSTEAEVRRWNKAAAMNRLVESMQPDAFPEDGSPTPIEGIQSQMAKLDYRKYPEGVEIDTDIFDFGGVGYETAFTKARPFLPPPAATVRW